MDAKQAITTAKSYVAEVFSDEQPKNIGLDEGRFDEAQNAWLITVGFSRSWDAARPFQTALGPDIDLNRTDKVVRIADQDGAVVSVTNRIFEIAGAEKCAGVSSSIRTFSSCCWSGVHPGLSSQLTSERGATRLMISMVSPRSCARHPTC